MKVDIVDSYPLSPMQQGMLLHSLQERGAYIEQLICDLHEKVNASSLVRAWQRVSERHAILRTTFNWERLPEPMQEVYPSVEIPSLMEDWRDSSSDVQQEKFNDYLRADRLRGLDVTTPPLMRLALLRFADCHYRVVWTFHHALLDGRSFHAVLQEVFALYDANGYVPELKTQRPYSDYVAWLSRQDWVSAEAYWRDYLNGFKPPASLRMRDEDREDNRPSYLSSEIEIPEEITFNLRLAADKHQITLNTLVQASWALLLGRYHNSREVVFGTTRACRHSSIEGAESMIGLFINTLPLRVTIEPQRSLLEWLKELREQEVVFRNFEHTPLNRILEWSDVPRGASLFETILVFDNYDYHERLRALGGPGQQRHFDVVEQTHYPLTLAAYAGSKLRLKIEYYEPRFAPQAIERMTGHLASLLEQMSDSLDRLVGQLTMLSQAERRQIVIDWNKTERVFSENCLHLLFLEQVERTPHAVAAVFDDQEISFAELNKQANQLAHYLQKQGVGPEVLVGIWMERSIEMVVALLGVLKAGGAYVPLDPGYPDERLSFMLADAKVEVLLTQHRLSQDWHGAGVKTIYLEKDSFGFSHQPIEEPNSAVRPDSPAYVIYTSGSTGQPKGVVLTHRAICNHMQWMQQEFPLGKTDSVLQKTPISFDASVWEFYAPLLAGGRLVMASPDGHKNMSYLLSAIKRYRVTTLQLGPSTLRLLLDEKGFADCMSLRQVFCGGEALTRELVDRFASCSTANLINLYGPTEACIDSTFWILDRERPKRTVAIGRPISNLEAYVLDQCLETVPVGVTGELYLGGAGLGRGYLHRPELTADRFVPHPFSNAPGARLYRTGDIVRYLRDGNIAYVGRADHQIKLRGFRIEPGEIESVLTQHPAVRQCIVSLAKGGDERSTLTAYVVAESERPSANELRTFARTRLPEQMAPSAFVYLEQLPLTANGKVDRAALPLPLYSRGSEDFVAPRDDTEETVAKIWSEVLGLNRVGVLDDFLDLGGDSLKAMQVISRISAAFQMDLPLGTLFEQRTVAALAAAIEDSLIDELTRAPEDDADRASKVNIWEQ